MVTYTWEAPGSGKQSTLSPRGMLGQVGTNALVVPGNNKKILNISLKPSNQINIIKCKCCNFASVN